MERVVKRRPQLRGDTASVPTEKIAWSLGPIGPPDVLAGKAQRSKSLPQLRLQLGEKRPSKERRTSKDMLKDGAASGAATTPACMWAQRQPRHRARAATVYELSSTLPLPLLLADLDSPRDSAAVEGQGEGAAAAATASPFRHGGPLGGASRHSPVAPPSRGVGLASAGLPFLGGQPALAKRTVSEASTRLSSSSGSLSPSGNALAVPAQPSPAAGALAVPRRRATIGSFTPLRKDSGWTRLAEAFLVRELSRDHSAPLETLQAAHKLFKARATFPDPVPGDFSSATRDGRLERPAFGAVVRELASVGADDWDLDRAADGAFKDADREHRAGICFREFSAWLGQHAFDELLAAECAEERLENRELCLTLGLNLVEVETYRRDFDKFDKSGSGTLDKDEFRQMMGELTRTRASDLPSTRIRLWWQTADRDQTGKINFEEFVMFHRKFFAGGMMGRTELAGDYYCSGMPCTRIARAAVL